MEVEINGAGFAGCILAHYLEQEGAKVTLVDPHAQKSNSRVAAGMVNPVGFKRWTVTPRAAEMLAELEGFVQCLRSLEASFWEDKTIWRKVPNQKEREHYFQRLAKPQSQLAMYTKYLDSPPELARVFPHGIVEVKGGWFRVGDFLDWSRKRYPLNKKGSKSLEVIRINCKGPWEGLRHHKGNLINWNKGQILVVRIPGFPEDHICNGGFFILPIGNGLFKVGSSYEHHQFNSTPSSAVKQNLEQKLTGFLGGQFQFELVDHQVGTRPTVRDREPIIGQHTNGEYYFNGLGTKGVLQAPYFAKRLVRYIIANETLPKENDIRRFDRKDWFCPIR